MENTFQKQIISEILTNQRLISIIEFRGITDFCDFVNETELSLKQLQDNFSHYDVPMEERGDTKLIIGHGETVDMEYLKSLQSNGIKSIFDIELKNDNLRHEYQEITGRVCPV